VIRLAHALFAAGVALLSFNVLAQQPPPKPAQPPPAPAPTPTPTPAPAPAPAPAKKPAPPKPGAAPAPPPAKPGAAPAQPAPEEAEPVEEEEETAPPPPPTQPPTRPAPAQPGLTPLPMLQPGADAQALERQGAARPEAKAEGGDEDRVYAEEWWSHARPMLELHGYFRVRAELFHNFSLGRVDNRDQAMWPIPIDDYYIGRNIAASGPALCTLDETGEGEDDSFGNAKFPCKNKSQAGANMRFRLNPELHISDNLRVIAQLDLLDNLVLGSTPEGYSNRPSDAGGYEVAARSGYTPVGALDTTQESPSSGINSLRDSLQVKRAWAEYSTPVGMLKFGRMPNHWGLGIVYNSGDRFDDDVGSTADRIMFVTGLKAIDLYVAGMWDFTNEGATSDALSLPQEQPYDLGQLDDVDQYGLAVFRKQSPELTKLALAKGQLVANGGAYVVYRKQLLANDASGANGACAGPDSAAALNCSPSVLAEGFQRRGAEMLVPDLWFQLLYKKFRFELEAVTAQGSIENLDVPGTLGQARQNNEDWKIRQYGIAGEIEQKLVEDKLRLMFMSGWASGDADVIDPVGSGGLSPSATGGLQDQVGGDNTISTFRFHPTYRVDLILNRNILRRIQGVYYFRPSVDYDFMRSDNGQRFGGGFAAVWTRASQFIQTPGHERDLGVELNLSLYFQSKDGSLNDAPEKMGGFFTMLQYGVLFPLAGLGYQAAEATLLESQVGKGASETSSAQVLRWYLGVFF
jgi:uncharacterized protein (TIGR04551 family)